MNTKLIALGSLFAMMLLAGFSPDTTQGEELLFFLPEVQFARSLNAYFSSPDFIIKLGNTNSLFANYSGDIDIPNSIWVNEQGHLRTKEQVVQSLNEILPYVFVDFILVFTSIQENPMFGLSHPVMEDIVSGNFVEHGGHSIDGRSEIARLLVSQLLPFSYLEDAYIIIGLNPFNLPEPAILGNDICYSLTDRILNAPTIEMRYAAFSGLKKIQGLPDLVEESAGLFDHELPENVSCFQQTNGSLTELESQARDGNVMATIALERLLVEQYRAAFQEGEEALFEFQNQLFNMMLRSASGASPLVALALIRPLSLLEFSD